jgi:hypothetical protein
MRERLGNVTGHDVVVERLRPFWNSNDRLSAFGQTDKPRQQAKIPPYHAERPV